MHILPSILIGFIVWIIVIMTATKWLYALGAGPLIVSGVALVACITPLLLPDRLWRRTRSSQEAG